MDKITKDTSLADILEMPGAKEVLAKFKVPCLSCPMAQFEIEDLTLEDVCKMYGIDSQGLLKDLNSLKKV